MAEARTYLLSVRLSPSEKKELDRVASKKKLYPAPLARAIILEYLDKNK